MAGWRWKLSLCGSNCHLALPPLYIRGTLADCRRQNSIKLKKKNPVLPQRFLRVTGENHGGIFVLFRNFSHAAASRRYPSGSTRFYADHMRYIAVIWRFLIFFKIFNYFIIFTYRVDTAAAIYRTCEAGFSDALILSNSNVDT